MITNFNEGYHLIIYCPSCIRRNKNATDKADLIFANVSLRLKRGEMMVACHLKSKKPHGLNLR